MNLFEIAGKIPGIDVRKQKLGSTEAVSITGPYKLIGYGLKFALFVGLVSIEQIARFGIRVDGKQCHLVLTQDRRYKLSKVEDSQLALLNDYHYAHQVTALDQGVNVAVLDKGFEPDTQNGKAFGQFAAAIFDSGKVRGTDTNTLLLLGRSARDRVLVASQWGKQNPLTLVDQEFTGDVRYSSVQDTTILVNKYGADRIAALRVDEIVDMFASGKVPTWQTYRVTGAEIEDIVPSIGSQPTVVLTMTINGCRQAVPANFRWIEKGDDRRFSLQLDMSRAVALPDTCSALARLSLTTITTVNGNGSNTPRMTIEDIDSFGSDTSQRDGLRRMATDAASGQIWHATA